MSNKLLTRLFLVVVAAVVAIFLLEASLYSISPGEVAVEISQDQATGATERPGLHWKSPNTQVIKLNARIQVTNNIIYANKRAPNMGGSARYALVWRLNNPRTYFNATRGKAEVALNKLEDAAGDSLRKLFAKSGSHTVFTVSPASVNAALSAAVEPVASKLGIDVLAAYATGATLSDAARKQVIASMLEKDLAALRAQHSRSKSAMAKGLAVTRAKAKAIIAKARQQAAAIEGQGEARIAGIYAEASKQAPDFFRFYQTLLSEQAALDTNTRLFIISTDSRWFRLLGTPPAQKDGGR